VSSGVGSAAAAGAPASLEDSLSSEVSASEEIERTAGNGVVARRRGAGTGAVETEDRFEVIWTTGSSLREFDL